MTDDDRLAKIRTAYSAPTRPLNATEEALVLVVDRLAQAERDADLFATQRNDEAVQVRAERRRAEVAEAERARLVAALTPLVEAARGAVEYVGNAFADRDSHMRVVESRSRLRSAVEAAAAVLQEQAGP